MVGSERHIGDGDWGREGVGLRIKKPRNYPRLFGGVGGRGVIDSIFFCIWVRFRG